jgi:putative ABC transport system permease protein
MERLARALVRIAGALVPSARRRAWREEWEAEIWHQLHGGPGSDPEPTGGIELLARCVGAIPHALWIRGEEWNVDTIWQDVRFAVRTFAKRPGFTFVVVATLALGIGANTAVFSVLDAVVVRPLAMPNSDRLLWIWGRTYQGRAIASVSPPDFKDYLEGTRDVFEHFAARSSFGRRVVLTGGDKPEEIVIRGATADFLDALGLRPALGRFFTPGETAGDSSDLIVISHALWLGRYGGDPSVIGRTMQLDGTPYTIVGVLPERLGIEDSIDAWVPLTFGSPDYQTRAGHFLRPIALLRTGVDPRRAQEALDHVSARLEAAYPETNDGWYALARPLQDTVVGSTRGALLVMMGAVGLVLLIACANVGNLLIARASERRGEIAVRAALGASRGRVTSQLLVESLLLSVTSAAVGLVVAAGGVAALHRLGASSIPRLDEVTLDGRVLGVTLAVSVLVGVAFGLMPAVAAGRHRMGAALGDSGRGRTARRRPRLRGALVGGEVALSFVLLVGAALLVRSFLSLSSVDPGFDERHVLTVPLSLADRDLAEVGGVALLDAVHDRVAALAGVRYAAFANIVPMSGSGGDTYVYAEGHPPDQIRNVQNTAELRVGSEDYFRALGIHIARGRAFEATDDAGSGKVVVINETLAARLFPDEDPVGRGLVVALDSLRTFRVVGVSADVRQYSFAQPARPEFWLAVRQNSRGPLSLVVKGARATPAVRAVREAVRAVDPGQPLSRFNTMEDFVGSALAAGRFQTVLLGVFASLALLLSAVGLYGVLAQSVLDRRGEIGVRLAMGARPGEVVRMVVGQGLSVAALGAAAGAVGALLATRLLEALLFGVGPRDPMAFTFTPILLMTVAALACWVPARRAARVDPVQSLRAE